MAVFRCSEHCDLDWLVGETDHRANCSCVSGFDGLRCQSRTTFSLKGNSYIKVPSHRSVI